MQTSQPSFCKGRWVEAQIALHEQPLCPCFYMDLGSLILRDLQVTHSRQGLPVPLCSIMNRNHYQQFLVQFIPGLRLSFTSYLTSQSFWGQPPSVQAILFLFFCPFQPVVIPVCRCSSEPQKDQLGFLGSFSYCCELRTGMKPRDNSTRLQPPFHQLLAPQSLSVVVLYYQEIYS